MRRIVANNNHNLSPTDNALLDYYTGVADNSPIPIIIYNMPASTVIDMSAETIACLVAHDNIVGMKDSGGDVSYAL